jgi:hypothetical protein
VQGVANGAATTNYGVYGDAINGTNNWAGYFDNGDVFIKGALSVGAATPAAQGTAGQVLTSTGPGTAPVWGSGSGWGFGGNAGLTDGAIGIGNNYIGTTTNVPLNFIVNNQKGGRIEAGTNANVLLGYQAGGDNFTGTNAVAIGNNAMINVSAGGGNVAVGYESIRGNNTAALNTGTNNSALGWRSLYLNESGSSNTALGYSALLSNVSGNNNTAIGYGADVTANNLINATAIGYNAKVATSSSLILGGTGADAVKVGIGITNTGIVRNRGQCQ